MKQKTFLLLLVFGFSFSSSIAMELEANVDSLLQANLIDATHAKRAEQLLVQDNGGRVKPLSTLSSQYIRKISRKQELYGQSATQILIGMMSNPVAWGNIPIIKISNPAESISLLKLQDFVLKNLIKRNSVSNFIPKKIHSSIKVYQDQLNRDCCVRVLSFIEGKMYAVVNHNKNLEYSLGALLGNLSKELQNLNHPNAFRKFVWDPSNISWIQKEINLF